MTVLSLFSCGTQISDMVFCDEVPGNDGAVCDGFLKSNPETLTQADWVARKAQWNAAGSAVACTQSVTVGAIKEELEKLCSETPWYAPCVYAAQGQIAEAARALREDIKSLAQRAR